MKNRKIYPWIVVGLLWFVALLNYMDRQMQREENSRSGR